MTTNNNANVETKVEAIAYGIFNVELTRSKKVFYTLDIDFESLPESSRRYIIAYGLKQSLADSMAAAENDDEARGLVDKRHAKLKEGTMGMRGSNAEPADPVEAEMQKIARKAVETRLRDKGYKLRGKDAVPAEKIAELITNYIAKQGDKLRKIAEENVKRTQALLGDDEEDDILGDFTKSDIEDKAGHVDANESDDDDNADESDEQEDGSDESDDTTTKPKGRKRAK